MTLHLYGLFYGAAVPLFGALGARLVGVRVRVVVGGVLSDGRHVRPDIFIVVVKNGWGPLGIHDERHGMVRAGEVLLEHRAALRAKEADEVVERCTQDPCGPAVSRAA